MKKILWILTFAGGAVVGNGVATLNFPHRLEKIVQERNVLELEAATCHLEQEQGCVCQKESTGSFRRTVVGKWTL